MVQKEGARKLGLLVLKNTLSVLFSSRWSNLNPRPVCGPRLFVTIAAIQFASTIGSQGVQMRFPTVCLTFAALAPLAPLAGCGQITLPGPQATEQKKEERVFLRKEFFDAVYEKSPEEVVKAVGKPDRTIDNRVGFGYSLIYFYNHKTRDPVNDRIDLEVSVEFRGFEYDKPGKQARIIKFTP